MFCLQRVVKSPKALEAVHSYGIAQKTPHVANGVKSDVLIWNMLQRLYKAKLLQDTLGKSIAEPGYEDWTYTTELVPSEMPGRVPGMAVVHQVNKEKAAKAKLTSRPAVQRDSFHK